MFKMFRTFLFAALLCVLVAATQVQAKKGFGDGGQEWGFVDVREGSHMFYWLYYAQGGDNPANKPLVLWLQGGPGSSSSGYGNFVEVGPLDYQKNKRPTSWADHVNLLFIDNPVGTGFSYVDSYSRLVTNNKQIATDLVVFMKQFLNLYPQFKTLPMYIFTESYGGKMVAEFALDLYREKEKGNVEVNLKTIALGDSWISPVDSVLSWGPYLLQAGVVDTAGFKKVDAVAQRMKRELEAGRFFQATRLWSRAQDLISELAGNIDFYNIIQKQPPAQAQSMALAKRRGDARGVMFNLMTAAEPTDDQLDTFVNEEVKPALGLTNYAYQTTRDSVFNALWQDIMTPVTDIVNQLLSETNINVVVYSGQLDLIVDTPGTLQWVNNLTWSGIDSWKTSQRTTLVIDQVIEGFIKSYQQFSFYWIQRSGHMVPLDNPQAALEMMRRVTGYDK